MKNITRILWCGALGLSLSAAPAAARTAAFRHARHGHAHVAHLRHAHVRRARPLRFEAGRQATAPAGEPGFLQSLLGLATAPTRDGLPAARDIARSAEVAARRGIQGAQEATRRGLLDADRIAKRFVGNVSGTWTGGASFYSGGRTASGGSVGAATCAHRTLPFGTKVLVTNLGNNRQEVLTVNDRGPFVRGRIVDVSRTAADRLGMIRNGTAKVRVQVVASR